MTNEPVNGKPFDLADVALTRIEEGSPMRLWHPATGAPLFNTDGEPLTITLLSQHSHAFRNTMREIQMQRPIWRAQWHKENPKIPEDAPLPFEYTDGEDVRLLSAVTNGWTIDRLDGHPFACTRENAQKFWSDPRFVSYRIAALGFIVRDGNFLSESSIASSAMPVTASVSENPSPTAA